MTITTVTIGARSTGRMTTRSTATPPANAIPSVAKNAAQYGQPESISHRAMNAENIAISPCAKLITRSRGR